MHQFLNTTTRTVLWVKKAADEGELTMRPAFQRNVVWSDRQKAYLIDTILREYPVPEIYMQDTVTDLGAEQHVVVDGQQRLNACLQYLAGEFALDAEDSPEWADMSFDDLTPALRKRIYEYAFVVRTLPEMPEPQLRGMFMRLNRSVVSLNPQELRQATYWGPFLMLMNELSDRPFWTTVGMFSANDVRRMLDVEYISELAIALLHGPQDKKKSLDDWYAAYEKEFSKNETVESAFTKVTGELEQLIPVWKGTRWRKKSDFYTLFGVFGRHVAVLPLSREGRDLARARLLDFSQDVDSALEDRTKGSEAAKTYAAAVERAASDMANRVRRDQVLEQVLQNVFTPAVIAPAE